MCPATVLGAKLRMRSRAQGIFVVSTGGRGYWWYPTYAGWGPGIDWGTLVSRLALGVKSNRRFLDFARDDRWG